MCAWTAATKTPDRNNWKDLCWLVFLVCGCLPCSGVEYYDSGHMCWGDSSLIR